MPEPPHDWFADEDFWEAAFPFMFPEARFANAAEQAEKVLKLVGAEPQCILDLCCGPGRHSVPLAKMGYRVTGVDRSPFLLNKARHSAVAAGLDIEWVEQDIRDFRRPASFDLAINLFTSFGYFEDDAENRAVLRNVFESLTSGGAFVIDTLGKEPFARIFQPAGADEVPGAGWMIQRRTVSDDWSRVSVEMLLIQNNVVRTHGFRHWLYSGRELKEMLRAAGFAEVRLYGNLDGIDYGPEAQRLVAVARKA
jgi:SAM-dependent methyltransferase